MAVTDFIQMIILVVGWWCCPSSPPTWPGGADKVIDLAVSRDMFRFGPNRPGTKHFLRRAITMMLPSAAGRVPARMSANTANPQVAR